MLLLACGLVYAEAYRPLYSTVITRLESIVNLSGQNIFLKDFNRQDTLCALVQPNTVCYNGIVTLGKELHNQRVIVPIICGRTQFCYKPLLHIYNTKFRTPTGIEPLIPCQIDVFAKPNIGKADLALIKATF